MSEKLIRDRMPAWSESTKGRADYSPILYRQVSSRQEHNEFLGEKILEEAIEVNFALKQFYDTSEKMPLITELADLQEVIDCLMFRLGVGPATIEKTWRKKIDERGSFLEGVVLMNARSFKKKYLNPYLAMLRMRGRKL